MTRLRRVRSAASVIARVARRAPGWASLRLRTDWPVWAVLAVAALVGIHVGRHHSFGLGVFAGIMVLVGFVYGLLAAEASGRREERDRRGR